MKRITSFFLTAILSCLVALPLAAQNGYEIKGVVSDDAGVVPGTTVMEKGTMTGTTTEDDGSFVLKVSGPDAIIEISCIGYKTVSTKASQLPHKIFLEADKLFLDDAVVIGYGSLKQKELSSSIVQVNKDKFFKGAMNNPMEMLTGKVAGLTICSDATANPNSGSSLQIRGATSLTAGNAPLIVIDGIIGGNLSVIAPQDIESMTVLKDAASSAIYGTRGANGVILVTTKKGSSATDRVHVTYDSWFATNVAPRIPEVLSADEFRRSKRGVDFGYETDWFGELMRDFSYDVNQYLSIDGNTDTGSYNASINYKNATGVDITSAREEFAGRAAVEQRLFNNRLQLNFSINARRANQNMVNMKAFDTALEMNPTMPIYNEDGTYYQPTTTNSAKNPVSEALEVEKTINRMNLLAIASAKVNIINNSRHNLNTSLNYSLDYGDAKENYYSSSLTAESFWKAYKGRAKIQYNKSYTNHLEWLLNYTMNIDKHHLAVVAGYSFGQADSEHFFAENKNFEFDSIKHNSIGSGSFLKDGKASMGSGKESSRIVGVFGRVNYNWNDLIMASASLRYEGATNFGANHKWGYFPAASLAWEIANMPFMRGAKDIVQSLKPRVSYGVTGRSGFGSYRSLSTYSASGSYMIDGNWVQGYAPSLNANPELGWEKLASVNVGFDFTMFNGRLRGSFDWFNRQSKDLLYNYKAPQPPFLYPNILVNVGTTSNSGIELNIEGDIFAKKDFTWTMGANYSYGSTYFKKLSNQLYKTSAIYMDIFRIEEGDKVGRFYGYEYAGVNEAGDMLVWNKNNEKIVYNAADPEDRRYIGNGTPEHFLNWTNTFRYKNFDLNLFFRGAFGYQIFNKQRSFIGYKGSTAGNVLRDAYLKEKDIIHGGGICSAFLENGDYFKLDNVTLGYTYTPKNTEILSSLRVYLAAKNVCTFTKYSGNDPSMIVVNGLQPGVDHITSYPYATMVTLGVTVRF